MERISTSEVEPLILSGTWANKVGFISSSGMACIAEKQSKGWVKFYWPIIGCNL